MPKTLETTVPQPIGYQVRIEKPSESVLLEMRRYGLPHIIKTFPERVALSIYVTKKDRFWRVNGKVTARNVATHILRTAGYSAA